MKKFLIYIALILLTLSCTDIGNSPLKGKWQLKTIEKEGITTNVDTVWYNFQSESIFSIQIYNPRADSYYVIYGFREEIDQTLSIEIHYDITLGYIDWTDRFRDFTIEKCTGKELILRGEEGNRYDFIRF
ncbi:MAG: lipocalin-like domain-containing protein [Tannerella sp.]|jgi:hypothetical protein|nr:lipocalin-like domain-containing protein [Tannerella sp.]